MKLITSLLSVLLLSFAAKAQDSTLVISDPIDITQDGWNKVLQLSNGNTMLFHFEWKKLMRIKVFNKEGEEIASQKPELKYVDMNYIHKTPFEELIELNGKAALFLSSYVDNVGTLIRLEFDGATGKLLAEEKVIQSSSLRFYLTTNVLKNPNRKDYAVACYNNETTLDSASVYVRYHNEKNELLKEVPLLIDKKQLNIDYVALLGCEMADNGAVMVGLTTRKVVENNVYRDALLLMYTPEGWNSPIVKSIQLPVGVEPVSVRFTRNSFTNNINIILRTSARYKKQEGINKSYTTRYKEELVIMPEDLSSLSDIGLNHEKVKAYIKNETKKDSVVLEDPLVASYITNSTGVSTYVMNEAFHENVSSDFMKYLDGRILITKYDDNGKEMWATVLPQSHYYVQTETFPSVFNGKLTRTSLRKSISICTEKTTYVFTNDVEENYNATIANPGRALYNYDSCNTVYYKINKKNVVTKQHFFGEPVTGMYKHIYPGSEHFDTQNKTIAVLFRKKEGKNETLHIAWRKMED